MTLILNPGLTALLFSFVACNWWHWVGAGWSWVGAGQSWVGSKNKSKNDSVWQSGPIYEEGQIWGDATVSVPQFKLALFLWYKDYKDSGPLDPSHSANKHKQMANTICYHHHRLSHHLPCWPSYATHLLDCPGARLGVTP